MLHLNNVGNSSHRSSILIVHTFDFSITVKIVYSLIKKKEALLCMVLFTYTIITILL